MGLQGRGRHEGVSLQLQELRRQRESAAANDGGLLGLEPGVQVPPLQRPLLLGPEDALRLEDPVQPHRGDPSAADPHCRTGPRPHHEPPRARSRHQGCVTPNLSNTF